MPKEKQESSMEIVRAAARQVYPGSGDFRLIKWTIALTLCAAVFLIYIPALNNAFVNWDDNVYVYENNYIKSIDYRLFKWAFTGFNTFGFHYFKPLAVFSHAVDWAIWGMNPWGHHLTSIVIHMLNTTLVFILVSRLTEYGYFVEDAHRLPHNQDKFLQRSLAVGFVTALLFGIHPLRVESVAWIAERNDVLCAFFYLLSLIAYLKYRSPGSPIRPVYYSACFILFLLALMSKPMAVSLPVVLLILDFSPLRRVIAVKGSASFKWILAEKLPFFLFSLFSSYLTLVAHSGIVEASGAYPLATKLLVVVRSYIFYLVKMLLPLNLAPFYPYPELAKIKLHSSDYLVPLILFLVICLLSVLSLKKSRVFFAVWFYYVVTLMPVSGIVRSGLQATADRFSYLPSLGPFFLMGLGMTYLYVRLKKTNLILLISFVSLMTVLCVRTVDQIGIWHNSVTLWSYEKKLFPDVATLNPRMAALVHNNLGDAYNTEGRYKEAIIELNTTISVYPLYERAYRNRAFAFYKTGKYYQAMEDVNEALKLNPSDANAYALRGVLNSSKENYRAAIDDLTRSVEINPKVSETWYNRGNTFSLLGNYSKALDDFSRAIEMDPQNADAYYNRGLVYELLDNKDKSKKDFTKALTINPNLLR